MLAYLSWRHFRFRRESRDFRNLFFLQVVTCHKKNAHDNKWNCNHEYDQKAYSNGVGPVIIHEEDKRAHPDSDHHKDDTTN